MPKRRLDTLLTERGLFASRSRAAAAVMAGEVRVGAAGDRAGKPGQLLDEHVQLSVVERPAYVSRGGVKLANALAATGLAVAGRRAIDVGCSTGGFVDCLLQHGAREVIAVDVGYGALAYSLRIDARVRVLERTNARALTPEMLPPPLARDGLPDLDPADDEHPGGLDRDELPDLATVDVSFISLEKVLPALLACLAPRHDVLALVKPQFEVGRGSVGKGGVVRDASERRTALLAVGRAAVSLGERVRGYRTSGLAGPKGNLESFIWLSDAAGEPRQSASELEELALQAEPP